MFDCSIIFKTKWLPRCHFAFFTGVPLAGFFSLLNSRLRRAEKGKFKLIQINENDCISLAERLLYQSRTTWV